MCITSGTEPVEQKCLDEFQVYKIKQEITQPAQIQNTVVHIPYYGLIVKHFLGTIIMGRKPGFGGTVSFTKTNESKSQTCLELWILSN